MTMISDLMKTILTDQTQILIFIFICIFALEMISGCTKAIMKGEFKSKIFREGLYSKTGYIYLMLAVFLFSMGLQMPYLFYATLIFVNCSEGVSILENIEEMVCPMPKFLKDILNREKKKVEDTIENETKNE